MIKTFTAYVQFQNIKMEILGLEESILSINFKNLNVSRKSNEKTEIGQIPVMRNCVNQLEEYFSGERKEFTIPFSIEGTDFQKRVWTELLKIPYGETISYLELARRLGDEKSIRAAASANGKNKLAIIIPCHRVIGANGSLTGYAGEIEIKKMLLELEKRNSKMSDGLF